MIKPEGSPKVLQPVADRLCIRESLGVVFIGYLIGEGSTPSIVDHKFPEAKALPR